MLVSMKSEDWKNLLKKVAPALGTALGGPAGGIAMAALGEVLLGDKNAKVDQIAAAVTSATPETLLALKKADQDFEIRMSELGLDIYKTEVDDRKSARELAKVDMRPQIVLSMLFIVGYFAIIIPMIFGGISPPETPMLAGLVLVITTNMAMIMQFWFGSSSGSKDKASRLP